MDRFPGMPEIVDKIKVTRNGVGYTFVKVTRESGGFKASAMYRAALDDDGRTKVAEAHARAVAEVDHHFNEILGG